MDGLVLRTSAAEPAYFMKALKLEQEAPKLELEAL